MRKFLFVSISFAFLSLSSLAHAQGTFGYSDFTFGGGYGYTYYPTYAPSAKYDPRIDPALVRAANFADQRAGRHSTLRCWHYVKDALVATGAVRSRPVSAYAIEAGEELMRQHGFVRLQISNPYRAPVGSVIVYGGYGGAGHVELRTPHGFASDYRSHFACRYRMIGVYVKLLS